MTRRSRIMGMTTSYFAAAAIFSQMAGHNLLTPHALAARNRRCWIFWITD